MAEIAVLGGYLPNDVMDLMTWPQYAAMNRFWRRWPPATISLALLAKLGPQQRGDGATDGGGFVMQENSAEDMAALAQMIGSAPPGVSV